MANTPRHFLDLTEMPVEELRNMLALSSRMKKTLKANEPAKKPLEGK
ncbi:MAG: ornithine carbamoyltransferase, partial [Bradyrhizobium sp.]|nr:ornithine carbamoyltransferase [Bradyrhizobium sp.]